MTLRTALPEAFRYLLPNDDFHCQTPLKNVTFDLFCSEKWQLATGVANRNWLIVTALRLRAAFFGNSKQLGLDIHRHNSVHLSSVYTDYSFSSVISMDYYVLIINMSVISLAECWSVRIEWGQQKEWSVRGGHRPLKMRTDGSHARVRELGSIGIFGFLLSFCQKWSVCYKI